MKKLLYCLATLLPLFAHAQCLQGVDLSYVNEVEANGGIYADTEGERVDPYRYFAERGAEMVRIRLWHSPENVESDCGEPITSGSLEDVLLAARRTDSVGMALNLALHYGDYFVDPGKQERPLAWKGLSEDVLLDSIYDYTYRVLQRLHDQGTTPAILAVGNETDNGFVDEAAPTDGFDWAMDAPKFNAGLRAVREFNVAEGTTVKSALHLTERYARFGAAELERNGVTDFDVLGLSYYPFFDPETTVANMGELISYLTATYGKEVMVFETGFSWNNLEGADNYNNFLGGNGNVLDYPASPEGQRDFLLDLTRTVCQSGGTGVLYWEPGWVTSEMCDAYGQGSSYENVSFFDFNNGNRALPAFDFLAYDSTVAARRVAKLPGLRVFANPYRGAKLWIESPVTVTGWEMLSADGKPAARGTVTERSVNERISIAPGKLTKGIYFLHLTLSDGRRATRRIVVVD